MGLTDMFVSNMLKPHSVPNPGFSKTGKAINAGIWGIYFLIFYFLSLAVLSYFFQPLLCIICFPLLLILSIIPALFMTAGVWIIWNILLFFWPVKGLQIGHELGKFELMIGEGWKFGRHLLKQKIGLNLDDSSPHILVVGGSQTGKSSTVKTILMKLMEKPKRPMLEAIRESIIPILAVLILLFLLFHYSVIVLTPIMLAIYLLQSGHLTQAGVYAGFAVYGFGISSIIAGLAWYVKRRYKSIMETTKGTRGNVIIDFHGEYGFLADKGFTVIDARDYDPLAPNYEGESSERIISDFVDAFLVAYETTGDVQLAILKKRLEEKRDVRGALATIVADAKSTRSFTEKDRLTGLYLRLEKIAAYRGSKAIRQLTNDSRNVIFDFSGIRDRDAADFYAENILSRYMALLTEKQGGINIIIDEAHRLNTKPLEEKGFEPTTIRIARESGKFGGRLIIASQNLTDFPAGFSANFGNIIIFRTPSGAELQILEKITGISYGLLQSVMNGLHKGEALLIGPHNHYSLIKIQLPKPFPSPVLRPEMEIIAEPSGNSPAVASVRIPRADEILDLLKKEGALTATEISRRTNYPKPAVWRHLQTLTKAGKIIRYEETETSEGMEIFYEINDPNRNESSFHRILVSKAQDVFAGKASVLGGPNNPDLAFNDIAIEVETGTKPSLDQFIEQVKRRFGQGYGRVVVVVINQKQKARYEKALIGMEKVEVVKFSGLAGIFSDLVNYMK